MLGKIKKRKQRMKVAEEAVLAYMNAFRSADFKVGELLNGLTAEQRRELYQSEDYKRVKQEILADIEKHFHAMRQAVGICPKWFRIQMNHVLWKAGYERLV